jgi:hypothetical protein
MMGDQDKPCHVGPHGRILPPRRSVGLPWRLGRMASRKNSNGMTRKGSLDYQASIIASHESIPSRDS